MAKLSTHPGEPKLHRLDEPFRHQHLPQRLQNLPSFPQHQSEQPFQHVPAIRQQESPKQQLETPTKISSSKEEIPSHNVVISKRASTYKGIPLAVQQPPPEAWKKQPAGVIPVRRLALKEKDEEYRKTAPNQTGFCVDELCSCEEHRCEPARQPSPFVSNTTYRATYLPHDIPATVSHNLYGPDGVPIGVDPKAWSDYVKKHGIPSQVPAHLFYRPSPDNRDFATEQRAKYTPKQIEHGAPSGYGPDGVPFGVDPKAWQEYIAKHGIPPPGQIPAHLFYRSSPDTRDFITEHRATYTPKEIPLGISTATVTYGPDGVPIGVDPQAWKEYVAKHGVPIGGQVPAHLLFRSIPENRDFGTEYRNKYTPKQTEISSVAVTGAYGPGGVPIGVDPIAWNEYVKKHGIPAPGQIPSHLFYRATPETRDFAYQRFHSFFFAIRTNYRANYIPHTIEFCPVTRLPAYPIPSWPREHTFWDPVAKKWY